MAEAAILERQEKIALSEKLNSKAAQEIETLLGQSERVPAKRETDNGGMLPGGRERVSNIIRSKVRADIRVTKASSKPLNCGGLLHCRLNQNALRKIGAKLAQLRKPG